MNFFRILIFAIIFISSHVSAFSQNYLNTIQIDSNDGGNQITLKTINGVEVVKEVKSDNLVVLELKNIKADEKLSTIYNNVLHVKNVIVKEPVKNNLQIVIEGENIANTGVVVLPSEIKQSASNKKNNNIILDKPINEYAPINSTYDNFDSQNNGILEYLSANFHVNTAKLLYLKRMIKNIASSNNFDFIFYAAVFILVMIIGNKFLNKENEKDVKIVGLSSQSLKQQKSGFDITINDKTIPTLRGLKSNGIDTLASEMASQQYGINEYKKSEKNPYTTSLITPSIQPKTQKRPSQQPLTQRRKQQKSTPNNSMIQKAGTLAQKNIVLENKTNTIGGQIDGQKFLDSMTKIYERSGRQDLAMNLKRVSQGQNRKKKI